MSIPAIRQWPMLRIFIPFAAGICFQHYIPQAGIHLSIAFITGIILVTGYGFLSSSVQFRLYIQVGIIILFVVFFAGMLVMFLQNPGHRNTGILSEYKGGKFLIRLVEDPVIRGKTQKANAELLEYQLPDTVFRISGIIQTSYLIDSSLPNLSLGQKLLINKPLDTIADNSNPGSFNFREYSLRQGTRFQVFLTKADFSIVGFQLNWLDRFLLTIRKFILVTIQKNIQGREEAGLAEALLIGYKNDLDKGLIQSYSNTGVVHVIAISGLHLALIYWIIGKLCDLLKFNKRVKPFVVIAGLWIFALLAGASPSVVRSAVMFTGIVAGEMIRRKSHILNSLAASAFILLCYNPFWLCDLGFQLSYIAVLSLVLYARPINTSIYIKNPLLSNIWNLVSVTIAAQILTTPLTLMQFHKFPILFLFTNGICVPLSSLLLVGELLLCSVSWSNTASEWIGTVLMYGLKLMNSVVRYFEKYPFSNFHPVQVSVLQTVVLYASVLMFMDWIINKRRRSFLIFMIGITAFSVLRSISFYQSDHQSKLIIYNVPGKMKVDVFEGRRARSFEYLDKQLSIAEFNQHILNSRIISRIDQHFNRNHNISGGELISIRGVRIAWFRKFLDSDFLKTRDPIDILVISNNALSKSMGPINGLKLRLVVADGTNSRFTLQKYRKFFKSRNIPFYAVSEQGAFVRNLN